MISREEKFAFNVGLYWGLFMGVTSGAVGVVAYVGWVGF
jgi:hypothetical protein